MIFIFAKIKHLEGKDVGNQTCWQANGAYNLGVYAVTNGLF